MIIGIDCSCWSNRRGFGRFTRELVGKLIEIDTKNDYILFVDSETARRSDFPHHVKTIVVSTDESPTDAASASGRRSIKDLWALTRAVSRHNMDVFFFPAVYSYFPILNRTKVLVTVHDAIADRHPAETFASKKFLYFWKLKQRLAIRQATLLLTVSEFSKRIICDFFKLPAEFVSVTTEAANPTFRQIAPNEATTAICCKYELDHNTRFILHVGGISPHKNLGRLVGALAELHKEKETDDVRLVLVGDFEKDAFFSDYTVIKETVDGFGLNEKVVFTGYIPDSELVHLYNSAAVLAFPSLEEGFGLPAIEAMSCGTPIAASNRGSLPEIIGDAGLFYDPTNISEMSDALRAILTEQTTSDDMRQKGLERAKQFTWEIAAERTMSTFDRLNTV